MQKHRKFHLIGEKVRDRGVVARIFAARHEGRRPMKLGYYPGCSLHGSSNDYEQSLRACLGALDVTLEEIDDWICCGATPRIR